MLADALLLVLFASQEDRRPEDKRPVVVVRGCLQGSELKPAADTDRVQVERYRLKIPKSLRSALKEHEGHEEELTGVLTRSSTRMGGSNTKRIGDRTKITVGTSEDRIGSDQAGTPQLEVRSFAHVAPVCEH